MNNPRCIRLIINGRVVVRLVNGQPPQFCYGVRVNGLMCDGKIPNHAYTTYDFVNAQFPDRIEIVTLEVEI